MAGRTVLEVVMAADPRSLERGFKRGEKASADFQKKTDRNNDLVSRSASKMSKKLIGAAGAAVGAYASISGAKAAISTTETLAKATMVLTKNLGLSVEEGSRWAAVAATRNIDSKALATTFGTLSKQATAASTGLGKQSDTIRGLVEQQDRLKSSGADRAKVEALGAKITVAAGKSAGGQATAFRKLGLSQKDLASGSKDFSSLLAKTADGFAAMAPGAERTAIGMKLFGKGWQTVLPVLRGGSKAMREQLDLADKYGVTLKGKTVESVADLAAVQRENKFATMGLQVALGQFLVPAMLAVSGNTAKLIAGFREGTGVGGAVASVVVPAFEKIKGAVEAAIPVVEGVVQKFKEGDTTAIAIGASFAALAAGFVAFRAVGSITTAFTALNLAMRANPAGLIVTAIAALAAGLYVAYKKSDEFRAIVDRTWASVRSFYTELTKGQSVGQLLTTAFNAVKGAIGTAATAISGFVSRNRQDFVTAGNVITGIVRAIGTVFTDFLIPVIQRALPGIKSVLDGMVTTFRGVVRLIDGIIHGDFGKVWDGLKSIVRGAVTGLLGTLRAVTAPVREALAQLARPVVSVLGAAFTTLRGIVAGAAAFVLRRVSDMLGGFSSFASAGAKIPLVGDKFRGVASAIDGARRKLDGTASSLENLNKKPRRDIGIKVKINYTTGAPPAGPAGPDGLNGDGLGRAVVAGAASFAKKNAPQPKLATAGRSSGALDGANSALAPLAAVAAAGGLRVTDGKRAPGTTTSSGGISYHGSGEALDLGNGRGPDAAKLAVFRALKSRYGPRLAELIYTPGGAGIKNGRPYTYGGKVAADHLDHVHVALDLGRGGPGIGDGPGRAAPAAAASSARRAPFTGDGPGVAAAAARSAGFRGSDLVTITAIAGAESGYDPGSTNLKYPDHSIGLWQINQLAHKGRFGTDAQLKNPATNARAAYALYRGRGGGFSDWSVYLNGAYRTYLARARAATVASRRGGGGSSGAGGGSSSSSTAKKAPAKKMAGPPIAHGSKIGTTKQIEERNQQVYDRNTALAESLTEEQGKKDQAAYDVVMEDQQVQYERAAAAAAKIITDRASRAASGLSLAKFTETLQDDVPATFAVVTDAQALYNEAVRDYGDASAEATAALVTLRQSQQDYNATVRDAYLQPLRQRISDLDDDLVRAQVETPDDPSDDIRVVTEQLAGAQAAYDDAVRRGDSEAIKEFGPLVISLRGALEQLTTAVGGGAGLIQAILDLKTSMDDLAKVASTTTAIEAGQLARGLADILSGQIVGRGLQGASQTAGAGTAVRY